MRQFLASDPIGDLKKELLEPVDIQHLARMHGVEISKLEAALAKDPNSAEFRGAEREMSVLKGIQKYLEESRKNIKCSGDVFHVQISPLPCRILTIGKRRFENLLHTNHRNRHAYTNIGAGVLYRCPIPGCAGSTLNQASVKRALLPHCRAYHRAENFRFAFTIKTKRGQEVLLYPPEKHCDSGVEVRTDTAISDVCQADLNLTPLSPGTFDSMEGRDGDGGAVESSQMDATPGFAIEQWGSRGGGRVSRSRLPLLEIGSFRGDLVLPSRRVPLGRCPVGMTVWGFTG